MEAQTELSRIKAQLKTFKRSFKETHGRPPNSEDIESRPKVLRLYQRFSALQEVLKGSVKESAESTEQENLGTFESNSRSDANSGSWLTKKELARSERGEHGKRKRAREVLDLGEQAGRGLKRVSDVVAKEFLASKVRRKNHAVDSSFEQSRYLSKEDSIDCFGGDGISRSFASKQELSRSTANDKKESIMSILEGDSNQSGQVGRLIKSTKTKLKPRHMGAAANVTAPPRNGVKRAGSLIANSRTGSLRHDHCQLLPVAPSSPSLSLLLLAPPADETMSAASPFPEGAELSMDTHDGLLEQQCDQGATFIEKRKSPRCLHSAEAGIAKREQAPRMKTKLTKEDFAKKKLDNPTAMLDQALAPSGLSLPLPSAAARKTRHAPSGQISENYVRMDLKKRWKGKSKLGSGKNRAHKEFMRKRGASGGKKVDPNTDSSSCQNNSGRGIIDSLLEAETEEGRAKAGSATSVPNCPGHGLPCKSLTVKKSGPNKGRPFFVCPLERGQQCGFFAWGDDTVETALREFYADDDEETRQMRYLESEKRKLKKITTKELKIRLKNKNLVVKGKKDELIQRLALSIISSGHIMGFEDGDICGGSSSSSSSESSASSDSDDSIELVEDDRDGEDGVGHIEANSSISLLQGPAGASRQKDDIPSQRDLEELLKSRFGFSKFRSGQLWGIQRTLAGESSLVVIPTGGGKSLIYQVAAMVSKGLTLVVSPLLSLMRDQLEHLPHGLHGAALNSTMGKVETARVMRDLKERRLKVLFISPERLFSASFQRLISTPGLLPPISTAVIDEAHCISEWSHNFRSAYMRLNQALRGSSAGSLGASCVLALTATATPLVVKHISTSLHLPPEGILLESWRRPNLQLNMQRPKDKYSALSKLMKSQSLSIQPKVTTKMKQRLTGYKSVAKTVPTIIYVFRTYDADNVAKYLKGQGLSADAYHGRMSWADRAKVQSAFVSGRIKIMVATIAFGMGMDKADVRCVIHFHIPKSIENYIQEVGRAGRDGKESLCYLLLDDDDFIKNHSLAHSDSVDMVQIKRFLEILFQANQKKVEGQFETNEHVSLTPVAVDLVQEAISNKLDMKTSVMETLLCHLVLPPYSIIKLLPNACITCTITCKTSLDRIKRESSLINNILSNGVRKVSLSSGGASGSTYSKGEGIAVKVNIPEAAKKAKVTESEVRKALDDLRFRSFVTTEWSDLSFRCLIVNVPPSKKFDELANFLWTKTKTFEISLRKKAEVMYMAAARGLCGNTITEYFDRENSYDKMIAEFNALPFHDMSKSLSLLRADIHVMLRDSRIRGNRLATPRAITRIFHGIPSPAFPRENFKDSVFYGRHIAFDFNKLLGYVQSACAKKKLEK